MLKASFEAWNRRELDALALMFTVDIEYDSTELADAVIHGRAALRAYFDQVLAVADVDFEVERLVEAGQLVCALLRLRGRGDHSGAPFFGHLAQVSQVEGGLIRRVRWFTDPEAAFRSLDSQRGGPGHGAPR
ncbi:MAG: hypothetical protein NVSMB51_09190 [Solirubrobacteraceae bacterium]